MDVAPPLWPKADQSSRTGSVVGAELRMPVSVLLEQIPFKGYLWPTMHRLPPLTARVQEHKGDPTGLGLGRYRRNARTAR